ncbi:iron export ABC transporter permease subunit FetB [Rossellomorea vietnamensis]|uniref:Iron export ABC transporter permease subunit FetB n=1 Tax=Rossellomorea vietnamensis TaxID=218284 RepID=A0A5D4NR33_9BACI|nr:iron export ABC transporter permease subunit FetB [Rossellomorea vietnamensis]TYS15756.1 iron export ABC transporter permease subunit FetB [Rossellomorea vietnamensis]
MNEGLIDIELTRLIAAYIFVLVLILIVKVRKISREKQIAIATMRMTIQLILAGYILTYIFDNPHPLLTIMIIMIMEIFAIRNVFKQVREKLSKQMKSIITVSMLSGSLASLLYFNLIVIHFSPWYDPRYFIPIAGMIIGNSMTGITLGVKTLIQGFSASRARIEGALMLGAEPREAAKPYVDNAFDSAVLPTINNMLGMGIVFLPGMMTGQILSGVSPLLAIEYQIAILLGILGSVSLTVIIFILLGYRTFFTKDSRLLD